MERSFYSELIAQYMPALVLQWEQEVQESGGYLQDRILGKDFSPSGDWSSINEDNSNAMAFVVDMDSPSPRIAQNAVRLTSGEIPKIAAELMFTEKDLTDINTMRALSPDSNKNQIIKRIFTPLKSVYLAQKERLEYMLYQGMSTGTAYADASNNTGTGIAIDFGFDANNKFFASKVWTAPDATPLKDITDTVLQKAEEDGVQITKAYMNQKTFNQIANDAQAKALVYPDVNSVQMQFATPLDKLNVALLAQFGFEIEVIKRKSTLIRDGKRVKLDGWKDGQIAFVTEDIIGSLVWARLAEDLDRVNGVDYANAEEFILLSKYKTTMPNYAEYDKSQSRSLCVLKSNIYLLDTTATA